MGAVYFYCFGAILVTVFVVSVSKDRRLEALAECVVCLVGFPAFVVIAYIALALLTGH
jgi:hypothetical protein